MKGKTRMPLEKLDSDQKKAATCTGGEVAVSAGAGSGKTRLLVGRYLYLIKKENLSVDDVVAITFTEKAAARMKGQIAGEAKLLADKYPSERARWMDVADSSHSARISTIHAYCNTILRRHPEEGGIDPLFAILDGTTSSILIAEATDSYLQQRLDSDGGIMDHLVALFGLGRLKRLYRSLLLQRTKLITVLDDLDFRTIDDVKNAYSAYIGNKIEEYCKRIDMLRSTAPQNDSLYDIIGEVAADALLLEGIGKQSDFNVNHLCRMIATVKSGSRKGSAKKWEERGVSLSDVREVIKEWGGFLEMLEEYVRWEQASSPTTALYLLQEYQGLERRLLEMKHARSVFDHDDTLVETWRLLRKNPSVCRAEGASLRHILVDEFQDTDGLQMDILRMIAGNSSASLFTVGDPKQSIYRFRGADVTIFNEFITRPQVEFKKLKLNYRSKPGLIEFTNHLFSRIMGAAPHMESWEAEYSDMKPVREHDGSSPQVEISVIEAANSDESRRIEAELIAGRMKQLHDEGSFNYSDMALLLRAGTRAHYYEKALLDHDVPYMNLTTRNPFREPESHDIAHVLSWLSLPSDPVAFTGMMLSPIFNIDPGDLAAMKYIAGSMDDVPRRFLDDDGFLDHPLITGKDYERIRSLLRRLLSLRDKTSMRSLLTTLFDETDYTLTIAIDPIEGGVSLAVIDQILDAADAFELSGGSLHEFAGMMSMGRIMADESPQLESDADTVTLISIHKSKGLEYPVVFLADVSAGVRGDRPDILFDRELGPGFLFRDDCGDYKRSLVYRKAYHDATVHDLAEQKRLFYVAVTRAEDMLFISGGKPPSSPDLQYQKSNWTAWLHAALDLTPEGEPSAQTPRGLFRYNRINAEDVAVNDQIEQYWRPVLQNDTLHDAEVECAIGALAADVHTGPIYGRPEHLSQSRIETYQTCPAMYVYRYVYSIAGTAGTGEGEGGDGPKYGDFAHSVLEAIDFHRPETWGSCIERFAADDTPDAWIRRLDGELGALCESSLYRLITEAESLQREIPFAFLHDRVLIRGEIDLVFRHGNAMTIVDYKTDTIGPEYVDEHAERYHEQLAMYALATHRATLAMPENLILYFMSPKSVYSFKCDEMMLRSVERSISEVISSMSSGNFEPRPSERCIVCSYRDICDRGDD